MNTDSFPLICVDPDNLRHLVRHEAYNYQLVKIQPD